jgi:ribosome-associated protein
LARLADELRCEDVVILDLRDLSPACDYFLIATGTSDRQMRSVADAMDEHAEKAGHHRYGLAGYEQATWLLVDYVDLVVHIFDQDSREYYDLELLWGDAPRLEWAD